MRFLRSVLLLAALSLQLLPAEAFAKPHVRAQGCAAFADFDWKKLGRGWNDRRTWNARDQQLALSRHREIRGPVPLPDLSGAEIVLSLTAGASETQEYRTETSSFVWRDEGKWQIDRVDYGHTWHVSPEPPGSPITMDDLWQEQQKRYQHKGPLVASKAAIIDQALADPCLTAQSDLPPRQIPTKRGAGEFCWGGTGTTIVITRAASTRVISDPCGRWAAGDLMSAVMYGQVDPEFSLRETVQTGQNDIRSIQNLWWGKYGYPYVHVICGLAKGADGSDRRLLYRTNVHGGKWRREVSVETRGRSVAEFEQEWRRFKCDEGATP